jgi:GT2 family glycosyltransferase
MTKNLFPDVTRIIVAYNSIAMLPACLDAIPSLTTVVVDNASRDDTKNYCLSRDEVTLVSSDTNLGFGSGVNLGLEKCHTTYALIINPDAILNANNLAKLITAAKRHPKAGLIGPKILDEKGSIERSHDKALHRRRGLTRKRTDPHPEGDTSVEFISGAVFLIRTSLIKEVGGFDDRFFLFYEDDDLSWRVFQAGHPNLFVPASQARHFGGKSTPPNLRIHFRRAFHMGKSLSLYRRKYLGAATTFFSVLHDGGRLLAKAIFRTVLWHPAKAGRNWGMLIGMVTGLHRW